MPSRDDPTAIGSSERHRRLYRAFGLLIEVNGPMKLVAPRATPVGREPDVVLSLCEQVPQISLATAIERYATAPVDGRDRPDFRFFELPDRAIVRIEGSADVHVQDERIDFHLLHPARGFLAEIVLGGLGLALWFERRGSATLHGSAADFDGRAVGFLATSGTGKSSLAAYLTAQGHALITEDLLVISDGDPHAHPGLAHLRLWPEQAARYVADWQALEQPHPGFAKRRLPIGDGGVGRLADEPIPLRRLYVLQRTDDPTFEVSLTDLSGADALRYLLAHSYLSEVGEGFGWQARRLAQLARLAGLVPVKLLRYRSGDDQLAVIRSVIAQDVAE